MSKKASASVYGKYDSILGLQRYYGGGREEEDPAQLADTVVQTFIDAYSPTAGRSGISGWFNSWRRAPSRNPVAAMIAGALRGSHDPVVLRADVAGDPNKGRFPTSTSLAVAAGHVALVTQVADKSAAVGWVTSPDAKGLHPVPHETWTSFMKVWDGSAFVLTTSLAGRPEGSQGYDTFLHGSVFGDMPRMTYLSLSNLTGEDGGVAPKLTIGRVDSWSPPPNGMSYADLRGPAQILPAA